MIENNSKPCLVQTPQGFSVSYNGKLLYSKYNPSKAIIQAVENLSILENTIILCFSPVLNYGINELLQKLPNDCYLILCEKNQDLFEFQKEQIASLPPKVLRLTPQELFNLSIILQQTNYITKENQLFPSAGSIRRVIRLDCSAGVQFEADFYNELYSYCISSIKTFWVNRITLTKFGRKYSRNFFVNLQKLPETTPIEQYFGSVEKSIIVCGAGESLNDGIREIEGRRNDFFIICVDTALSSLLKNGIEPDAVFIEEAQSVILKAFIGCKKINTHIFCALSAIPNITHFYNSKQISFYTTLYTNASFLQELCTKNIVPSVNNPLGSVGLTVVEYALKFRKNNTIPVFVYGLDFSYSKGCTHAKGTMAHLQRLFSTNRLIPVENYTASFSIGTQSFFDQNNKEMITSQNLKNYADLFINKYSSNKNLFTATKKGIQLNIPFKSPVRYEKNEIHLDNNYNSDYSSIIDYLKTEKSALLELRDILSGKIKLSPSETNIKIEQLAKYREYLYLHFPDGYKFSMEISFLKRIRTEIDYFLKYFN